MAQTTRSLVLQWYRKCLRSSRTWPGPEEEKKYIKDEAIHGFRSSKGLTDTNVISRKVAELAQRYEVAWHYKIPYPRLHHSKQTRHRDIPQMSNTRI